MRLSFPSRNWRSSCGITHHFWWLSPAPGQIAHVFLTRPPRDRPKAAPFDLHALGTPPALILSQDQTLHQNKLPQAAPLARRSLRACVPLLVSHPVAPAPRLATTPGTPLCIDVLCVHVAPPDQTRVPVTVSLLPLQRTTRPAPPGSPPSVRSVFHAHLSRCFGEFG